MAVENPTAPALATISGVELGSVGYWDISNIMGWHPTAEDMAAAVAALDCPAVRRPVLKFGHTGEPGEGDPAIGVIDNLRLTEEGQTLVGDFVGVPAWLADADSEGRSVIASAYPDRSGEWAHNYECQLGHTHPFVLHAMALLGVVRPGIGTLESLYDLYTNAPDKEEVAMAKAPVALAGTTTDEVRKAYYNGPAASNYYLWIREMYVDPPELIVQDDNDDTLLRVPYSVTGDGEVEFADGQAVKVEYVAARAKAEKPSLAFASRMEARTTPQNPSAGTAPGEDTPEGKEPPVATLNEGLAELLGISADSDDEAILEAAKALKTAEAATEDETADDQPEVAAASTGGTPKTVTVSASVWEEMQRKAEAGAEARQVQIAEANEGTIRQALTDGKILPKEAKEWREALASTPDVARKLLDGMPKNRALATSEVGHGTQPIGGEAPDDLGWFDSAPTEPSTGEDA